MAAVDITQPVAAAAALRRADAEGWPAAEKPQPAVLRLPAWAGVAGEAGPELSAAGYWQEGRAGHRPMMWEEQLEDGKSSENKICMLFSTW